MFWGEVDRIGGTFIKEMTLTLNLGGLEFWEMEKRLEGCSWQKNSNGLRQRDLKVHAVFRKLGEEFCAAGSGWREGE